MVHYIYWQERCVAGNPRINRREEDERKVWCYGYTRMEGDREEVINTFTECFPTAEIIEIT